MRKVGRPAFDLSNWNDKITVQENAANLRLTMEQAYYFCRNRGLKFKRKPWCKKPVLNLFIKDQCTIESAIITVNVDPQPITFSLDHIQSLESNAGWEGAD